MCCLEHTRDSLGISSAVKQRGIPAIFAPDGRSFDPKIALQGAKLLKIARLQDRSPLSKFRDSRPSGVEILSEHSQVFVSW